MGLKVHQTIKDRIKHDRRDIVLIAAPGMGLTSLLDSLDDTQGMSFVRIDARRIQYFWEKEYQARPSNRRFVIHAATIRAIVDTDKAEKDIAEEELFKTNLVPFLKEHNHSLSEESRLSVVIDDFDDLQPELAKIVCDELKRLDDMRSQEATKVLGRIRFIIAGMIDFQSLYQGVTPSGVSPATNFSKYRPHQFLLSPDESTLLIESTIPKASILSPNIRQLVVEWSGGYVHYVLEFGNWILNQQLEQVSIQQVIAYLKSVLEDQDRVKLYERCYSAWDVVRNNQILCDTLITVISAGYVHDFSERSRELARLGFLIEKQAMPKVFQVPNKLIELFIRQRLAELGKVLPLEDSAVWATPSISSQAYALFLKIENQLRNFIGDRLYAKYKSDWIETGMNDINDGSGAPMLARLRQRRDDEQASNYALTGTSDPFVSFLEFGDLGPIIEARKGLFPEGFAGEAIPFLSELNYLRRRIAHNRLISWEQIYTLETRWSMIQRMMARRHQ